MATTYELIEAKTLSTTPSSVTFSSIPNTYTDLKLVVSARGSHIYAQANAYITYNGSSSNYKEILTYGYGGAAGSTSASTDPYIIWGIMMTGGGATANTFGNSEIYIPNYASSNYKSSYTNNATENNGTEGWNAMDTALWSNTSAITSITLTADNGSFVSGSSFYLYGIKNS